MVKFQSVEKSNRVYTNFYTTGSYVNVRGFDVTTGDRFQDAVRFKPSVFVPSTDPEDNVWTTVKGEPLKEIVCHNVYEAKTPLKHCKTQWMCVQWIAGRHSFRGMSLMN